MRPQTAKEMTLDIMSKCKLTEKGWRFQWLRGRRVLGKCRYLKKEICLSLQYVIETENVADVKDTIIHECAHALDWIMYNKRGHGKTWRNLCRVLGATPRASFSEETRQVFEAARKQTNV